MASTDITDKAVASVIEGLALSGYAQDFVRMELGRGLEYHRARIAMLGLWGNTVLDAGCGVGNWTLPLSERYTQVEALEYNRDRLAIVEELSLRLGLNNIRCLHGSIEALPYAEGSIDVVFCNGVVFLTDIETSLSEFRRVLAPGGLLYVTYNTKGWWRFLINVRGPKEPNVRVFGLDSFEDRARRIVTRLGSAGLLTPADRAAISDAWFGQFGKPAGILGRLSGLFGTSLAIDRMRAALTARAGQEPGPAASALSRATLDAIIQSGAGADLADLADCLSEISRSDASRYEAIALALTRLVWLEEPLKPMSGIGRCMEPQEMASLLERLGLEVVASGSEGTILLDPVAARVTPIYAAEQGVWETVARKAR